MLVSEYLLREYKSRQKADVIIECVPKAVANVRGFLEKSNVSVFHDISIRGMRFISVDGLHRSFISYLSTIPGVKAVTPDMPVRFDAHFIDIVSGFVEAFADGWKPRDFILGHGVNPMHIASMRSAPPDGVYGSYDVTRRYHTEYFSSMGIDGSMTKVCVIDTGIWTRGPAFAGSDIPVATVSRYFIDRYFDSSGHGTHVSALISGKEVVGPNGLKTKGVSNAQLCAVKALRTPAGVSKKSDVLKAVEIAERVFKPNIYNLSLGSDATDSAYIDPLCKAIAALDNRVFVVASGNSGAGNLNTPGISPHAVSVGSWSIIDNAPVWFTSRGTSIDGVSVPNTYAYGGGRSVKGTEPDELIYAPTSPMSVIDTTDKLVRVRPAMAFGAVHGTSQASPQAAGVLALWRDAAVRMNKPFNRSIVLGLLRNVPIDARWWIKK